MIYALNKIIIFYCGHKYNSAIIFGIYILLFYYFQCNFKQHHTEKFPRGVCWEEIRKWQFGKTRCWFDATFCDGRCAPLRKVATQYFWTSLQAYGELCATINTMMRLELFCDIFCFLCVSLAVLDGPALIPDFVFSLAVLFGFIL